MSGKHQAANQWLDVLRVDGRLDLSKDPANGPIILARVQNKTADYTCLQTDSGTHFFNYGDAGAIVFTLPVNPTKGWHAWFINAVDQSLNVTNGTSGAMIAFNTVAGVSVDFDQSSNKIGQCFFVIADGNKYYALAFTGGTLGVNT